MTEDIPESVLLAQRAERVGRFIRVGDLVGLSFRRSDGPSQRLPVLVTGRTGVGFLRGEVVGRPKSRGVRVGQVTVFGPADVAWIEPYTTKDGQGW